MNNNNLHISKFGLNFFENETNCNTTIIAGSSSGIGFITTNMITNIISDGGSVVVFDFGRTYKHLCDSLGGQSISAANLKMNLLNVTYSDDADCTKYFLVRMVLKLILKNYAETSHIESLFNELDNAVVEYAATFNGNLNGAYERSIGGLLNFMSQRIKEEPDNIIRTHLFELLNDFFLRGNASKLFNHSNSLIDNVDQYKLPKLIVVEFEDIVHDPKVFSIVYNAAILVFSLIFLNPRRFENGVFKQMILFSEAPFNDFDNIDEIERRFIDHLYTSACYFNTSFVSFTRKLSYYYKNPMGFWMYSYSGNKIFIDPDDFDRDGSQYLTDKMKEMVLSTRPDPEWWSLRMYQRPIAIFKSLKGDYSLKVLQFR